MADIKRLADFLNRWLNTIGDTIREWEDRIVGNTQFVAKRKMKFKKTKKRAY